MKKRIKSEISLISKVVAIFLGAIPEFFLFLSVIYINPNATGTVTSESWLAFIVVTLVPSTVLILFSLKSAKMYSNKSSFVNFLLIGFAGAIITATLFAGIIYFGEFFTSTSGLIF